MNVGAVGRKRSNFFNVLTNRQVFFALENAIIRRHRLVFGPDKNPKIGGFGTPTSL